MGPVYWDPVHDVSSVVRGTWFYRDTMLPVESDLANQIEEGYEYMKPWTQSYNDEINSCLEIGAEAELKIVYKLWTSNEVARSNQPDAAKSGQLLLGTKNDKVESDEQNRQPRATHVASQPENRAAGILDDKQPNTRLYAKSGVIYANSRDAQILRPSLFPSVARGRRPLAAIRKGRSVGIPVIRGFNHKAWEKLHPPSKPAMPVVRVTGGVNTTKLALAAEESYPSCFACHAEENRPKVTDLVLVIHGLVCSF